MFDDPLLRADADGTRAQVWSSGQESAVLLFDVRQINFPIPSHVDLGFVETVDGWDRYDPVIME